MFLSNKQNMHWLTISILLGLEYKKKLIRSEVQFILVAIT